MGKFHSTLMEISGFSKLYCNEMNLPLKFSESYCFYKEVCALSQTNWKGN